MNHKAELAKIILDRTAQYVPLNEARVVTMGGRGVEPRVWQKHGVLDTNGWLVEHSLNRGSHLIKNLKYRVHNQLGTLYQVLIGCYGTEGASIDSCHLDLCGTLSGRASADFSSVLPLVLKSRARCLAVTVADARQNATLERWPDFEARGKKIFGEAAKHLLETFKAEQEKIPVNRDLPSHFQLFDPEKGAKREFGVLVELAELLFATSVHWTPDLVERYVYVSRYSGKPFRMRTYLIRFGHALGRPASLRRSLERLVEMWVESPLFYANGGGFTDIDDGHRPAARAPKPEKKPLITPKHRKDIQEEKMTKSMTHAHLASRLGEVAKAMGGAELDEYNDLVAAKARLDTIVKATPEVENLLRALSGKPRIGRPPGSKAKAPETDLSADTAGGSRKRKYHDLSEQQKIVWLLEALEARARGLPKPEWLELWRGMVSRTFGHYSKTLGYHLRTAMATTSGRFRPQFENRIRQAFDGDAQQYLDRLAKLPLKLTTP